MQIDFFEGLMKVANLVLSLVAGYIAFSLFKVSNKDKILRPWKVIVFALLFFMVQEVLGALRAFGIFSSPFLTHVVPTMVLALLIWAIALQIHIQMLGK